MEQEPICSSWESQTWDCHFFFWWLSPYLRRCLSLRNSHGFSGESSLNHSSGMMQFPKKFFSNNSQFRCLGFISKHFQDQDFVGRKNPAPGMWWKWGRSRCGTAGCAGSGISLAFIWFFTLCLCPASMTSGRNWKAEQLCFPKLLCIQGMEKWDSEPALAVFYGKRGSLGMRGSICSSHPLELSSCPWKNPNMWENTRWNMGLTFQTFPDSHVRTCFRNSCE